MKYSKRQKVEHQPYTIDNYRADVEYAVTLPTFEKGAALTAACKRLKQYIILCELENVVLSENIDITPTLAKHIIKQWLGRGVSYQVLLDWFGIDSRTAADKSHDHKQLDLIVEKGKSKVDKSLEDATKKMKDVRRKVSLNIKRNNGKKRVKQ